MRRLLPLILLALTSPTLRAQAAPAANITTTQNQRTLFSRIRGLFDFDLPNLDPPGTVKLIFNPHFSDLVRRDYLRVDSGIRWAINDHFDISPEASIFLAHGLGGSNADGYGIGELRLGTKYVLPHWPDSNYETSLFVNVSVPVGHPPVHLTDGFNHVAPGFLVQHLSTRYPRLTTFSGAGLDLITKSRITGIPYRNEPRDDSMNATAGAIYDQGQVKWTLTATYATTAGLGATSRNFFYVRPSLLWYVPKKYTFSKTQWILGLGVRASWGPDGTELSVFSRVRAEITFRQVMEQLGTRLSPTDLAR